MKHKYKNQNNKIELNNTYSSDKQAVFYTLKLFLAIATTLGMLLFFVAITHASSITSEKVVSLVNEERVKDGAAKLAVNKQLEQAAIWKAQDMIDQNYFAHVSPEGVTPWHWIEKAGYDYKYAGENLAMDFTNAESEQEAWMNSKTHRQNILNQNYQEIGVAVKEGMIGDKETIVVVQMFGGGNGTITSVANEQNSEPVGTVSGAQEIASREKIFVVSPQDGSSTNLSEVKIVAQAVPSTKFFIYDRGIKITQVVSDNLGLISYSAKDLKEGLHEFQIQSADGGVTSEKIKVEVDLTPPQFNKGGIIAFSWADDPQNKLVIGYKDQISDKLFIKTKSGITELRKEGNGYLEAVVDKDSNYTLIAYDKAGNQAQIGLFVKSGDGAVSQIALGDQHSSRIISPAAITFTSQVDDKWIITVFVLSLLFLIIFSNAILIIDKNKAEKSVLT